MAVGSAELGDSWMIVSIGVSIISFSLSLKASRRSDEPDLRLETFSSGTDFPKNIFLVTTEKKVPEVLSLYCFSTFEFPSNGAVDEEVDRSIHHEEEMIQTHQTEIPGWPHQQ